MESKKIKPPDDLSSRGTKVTLDWKAYFIEFCKVHGEPVNQGGRLLFRDGWTYSSTAYEGPEFAPPTDLGELDVLIREYWVFRQSILSKAISKLLHERDYLSKLEAMHSLPLQQTVIEDDGERKTKGYKRVNVEGLMLQIQWVSDDLKECDERLREIEAYHKAREVG